MVRRTFVWTVNAPHTLTSRRNVFPTYQRLLGISGTLSRAMHGGTRFQKAVIPKLSCCFIDPCDSQSFFDVIFIKIKFPWLAVLNCCLAIYGDIHTHLKNCGWFYPDVARAVYICNSWK